MTALELFQAAADLAVSVRQRAKTPSEAVMLCGLMAARIAASVSDQERSDHMNSPQSLISTLAKSFNSAMEIETAGSVRAPRPATLNMAE